mgnify:CR=1 FL=1
MTRPEMFRDSQCAIERGHVQGAQSVKLHEAAQAVINETRQLLSEMAQLVAPSEEHPE